MKSVICPTNLGPVYRQGGDMPKALTSEEWKKIRVKTFSFLSEAKAQ